MEKEAQITDEMLEDYSKNPDKLQGLSPEMLDTVLAKLDEKEAAPSEDAEKPSLEDSEPEKKPESSDKADDTSDDKIDKKDTSDNEIKDLHKSLRSSHQKEANELNKWTQKINSTKERIKRKKAEFEALSKKEIDLSKVDVDPIDRESFKEFIKNNELRLARLEQEKELLKRQLLDSDEESLSFYNERMSDSKNKTIFSDIEGLQKDYPVLQTKEPIEALNSGYAAFLDGLVSVSGLKERDDLKDKDQFKLRDMALNMFDTDPVFKQKAESLGVRLPKALEDKEEMEKYDILTSLYQKTQDTGGTLRGHWLEHLDKTGKLENIYNKGKRDAALSASRKTADAIENNSPSPLSSSDGPGDKPSATEKMTMEKAQLRLNAISEAGKHRRLSAEEVGELDKLLEFLDAVEGTT